MYDMSNQAQQEAKAGPAKPKLGKSKPNKDPKSSAIGGKSCKSSDVSPPAATGTLAPGNSVNESNEKRFQSLERALEKQNTMLEKLCNNMSHTSSSSNRIERQDVNVNAQGAQSQVSDQYMEGMDPEEGSFVPDYEYPYDYGEDGYIFSLSSAQAGAEQVDPAPTISPSVVEDEVVMTTGQDGDSVATPMVAKGFAARFQAQAPMGPDVNKELADSLNIMLSERMGLENMGVLMDKYVPPKNVPNLVVPKVNPLIWDNIPAKTKSKDLRLQKLQKPLIKGMIAVTELMKDKTTPEQEEAIALLAHANNEINMFRRESIKPDLNPNFQPLCRSDVKVTKHLFGEDLGKVVKDMTEQQKAVSVTRLGFHKVKVRGLLHIQATSLGRHTDGGAVVIRTLPSHPLF
ncbi:uncharacterized protein LOC121418788 [Lytechinus variegatus]|uniref:uncharacterized protein LOC121418788 n=1 Tax=Lytechinus variegatus TaxID=7654 RepID=UPI001BB18072|nr:uncharacterized protein LOC121418788 [Lytechinus variegatus]